MPAYLIANVIIKDSDKFKDYTKATSPIIKQFSGVSRSAWLTQIVASGSL